MLLKCVTVLSGTMISESLIGQSLKESGSDLFYLTMPQFVCTDRGKPWKLHPG